MRVWVIRMIRQVRRDVEFRTIIGRHETSFARARNQAVYENFLSDQWITWDAEELPFFPAVPGS